MCADALAGSRLVTRFVTMRAPDSLIEGLPPGPRARPSPLRIDVHGAHPRTRPDRDRLRPGADQADLPYRPDRASRWHRQPAAPVARRELIARDRRGAAHGAAQAAAA